jgi:predicted site-specific integrase-resolvase
MQAKKISLLDDYWNPADLARALSISTKTLDRWRIDGTGPPITKLGRRTYYSKTGVATWLGTREQKRISLGRGAARHDQQSAA